MGCQHRDFVLSIHRVPAGAPWTMVMVRGWWSGGDGEGMMSAPPAPTTFPDLPYLLPQTLGMLWAAPACQKPVRANGNYMGKHTLLCSWFLRHQTLGQECLASSQLSQQGSLPGRCKRAVGLLQGGEGGWGDASSNNTQCSPDWIEMNFTVRKKPGLKCVI